LVNQLVTLYRRRGQRVGIVAVDPSSPFTGGAVLGDRVRMRGGTDEGVFFRSMATRGVFGGLSAATRSAVNVLDACGFDVVIIETVGVGQSEVDIVNNADVVVVLSVPGLGDDIQIAKAGLLEIGDIYAVNKCDLPGADMIAVELRAALHTGAEDMSRDYPIILVSAEKGTGLEELFAAIDEVFKSLEAAGEIVLRRGLRISGGMRTSFNSITGGNKMKCLNIDHIGVAVKSLEEAAEFYENVLGIKRTGIEQVDEQQVKVMFLPCGDCEVELLQSTSEGSAVDRFIAKNGEGVQHIAIRVENIEAALAQLKEKGIRLIDETPRYGAGGARIAFVHPKAVNGVLLELCERNG